MYKSQISEFHKHKYLSNISKRLSALSISDPAFRILLTLIEASDKKGRVELSLSEIGERCLRKSRKAMSRANVSRYLSELEREKLIERREGFIFLALKLLLNQQHLSREGFTSVVEPTTPERETVVEPTTLEEVAVVEPTTLVHFSREIDDSKKSDAGQYYSSINTSNTVKELKENNSSLKVLNGTEKTRENEIDDFTRERFSRAPCSLSFAKAYFERFFIDHKVEGVDAFETALEFFDYWENRRDWMKIPKGRKTPVIITSWEELRYHATTWAKNIKRDARKNVESDEKNVTTNQARARFNWLNAEETNQHALRFKIMARHPDFYEWNEQKGKEARWRFKGFANQIQNTQNYKRS